MTLAGLNSLVRQAIEADLDEAYWITAELNSVRIDARGHCRMELVEHQPGSDSTLLAKAAAVVWRSTFELLHLHFSRHTGQQLSAGMKVKVQVRVQFHELYGYSLIVCDIDPAYTLGSLAQRRAEIMQRLTDEGVADDNKQLPLPTPLLRIAVVSSASAAGYEDFMTHLSQHPVGYRLQTQLFPAVMQGEAVRTSIIQALDCIARQQEQWDAVAIIRGGGAASDLSGFDTYELAQCCAQFPLPILTGIGHERDTTVLDMVANRHLRTPTAVAAFILAQLDETAAALLAIAKDIRQAATNLYMTQQRLFQDISHRLQMARNTVSLRQQSRLAQIEQQLHHAVGMQLQGHHTRLLHYAIRLQAADPANILRRGYTITRSDGKVVRDSLSLKPGTIVETQTATGTFRSKTIK